MKPGVEGVAGILEVEVQSMPVEWKKRRGSRWAVLVSFISLLGCSESRPSSIAEEAVPKASDGSRLPPEAKATFDEAIRMVMSEPSPANWSELARRYHAHEELEAAIECHRLAIAVGDRSVRTPHLLAMALDETGDRGAAIESMSIAVGRTPSEACSHWRLGQWLFEEGREADAERIFAVGVGYWPDDFGMRLATGRFLLNAARADEALPELTVAMRISPKNLYARFLVGSALVDLGREEEAERLLSSSRGSRPSLPDRHLLELEPLVTGPQAELRRLIAFSESGRSQEAIDGMLALEDRLADQPDYQLALVRVHRRLGQSVEAQARIDRTLEIDPGNLEAPYQRAGLLLAMWESSTGKDDDSLLVEALRVIDGVLRERGTQAASHAVRAQVLAALGRVDESSEAWMAAHDRDSAGSNGFDYRAARVYMAAGRWDDAAARLKSLVSNRSWDVQLRREYGLVLVQAGRPMEALPVLRSVMDDGGDDDVVRRTLVEIVNP